jgi:NADH-quinone oxidoreductase subunit L
MYAARPQMATGLATRLGGLRTALANKYWVDELYDAAIVRPTRVISDRVLWRIVDSRIIDGLVNLVGGLMKVFSYLFRFVQSGYVQTYVLVVVVGVLALLVFWN